MKLKKPIQSIFLLLPLKLFGQADSLSQRDTFRIDEVQVKAYFNDPLLKNATSSAVVIDSTVLQRQQNITLLPAMNSIAGVRMEERSPGSYRFSIRGSLLRSPFGVRNVKFYIHEFSFTDAGGNTYLNLIDPYFIRRVEILKGPDGSLYGANSGGVVRFRMIDSLATKYSARFTAGSYGYLSTQGSISMNMGDHTLSAAGSSQYANSYRKHSSFDRFYGQISDLWKYSRKGTIRMLFMMSDLSYETPGGLTRTQFQADPSAARPATLTLPSAAEQNASISNYAIFGGIQHEYQINERGRHVIAVFGQHSDIKNPFITNYEERNELNSGLRTYFEYSSKLNKPVRIKGTIGLESQSASYEIANFQNEKGKRDTLMSWDRLGIFQHNIFLQALLSVKNKLTLEAAISVNGQKYYFESLYPAPIEQSHNSLKAVYMPKVAAAWQLIPQLAWRATVSKGYSPPTISEVRASNQKINKDLRAESGWNYESGLRISDRKGLFWWDLNAFYFILEDAIVRQVDTLDQEYFINAGSTEQPGMESQMMLRVYESRQNFLRKIELRNAYTYYRFRFKDYLSYSGNQLTGVPEQVIVSSLYAEFKGGYGIFIQHNYTSEIAVNDANTEYAEAYNLIQLKISKHWNDKTSISIGVDNLLDERYSLGNDLNAFGGRYYNAAPPRNYYASLSITLF